MPPAAKPSGLFGSRRAFQHGAQAPPAIRILFLVAKTRDFAMLPKLLDPRSYPRYTRKGRSIYVPLTAIATTEYYGLQSRGCGR